MRLDNFDPNNVDVGDQRGRGGGFPGFGGGGRGLSLGGGGLGLGTIVLLMVGAWVLGINPLSVLGLAGSGQPVVSGAGAPVASGTDAATSCNVDTYSHESCNALASLNTTWASTFAAAGHPFSRPRLWFYARNGRSGCGAAQSAMGPFYCPADHGIYLDTDFYREMDQKLGATGQFARLYVIAHEYGHHIQSLRGVSDRISHLQRSEPDQANHLSVMLELQADCYAGVWAAKNKDRMDKGDMESGLNAAHQIGDDVLIAAAGRTPTESAFTHGSAAQRMEWLRRGMETGDPAQCNTFKQMGGA